MDVLTGYETWSLEVKLDETIKQRDELLHVLKQVQASVRNGVGGCIDGSLLQTRIEEAIAKVESK